MKEKHLTYRGDIRGVTAADGRIAFVVQHREKMATAIYWLDPGKAELDEVPLDCGATAIVACGKNVIAAGDDNRLYRASRKSKKPDQLEAELPENAAAICVLKDEQFAVVCGQELVIVSAAGKVSQSFPLPEEGTSISADPTGEWFAVGMSQGSVRVFECEDKDEFQISETEKLHNAAVMKILFELEELRFLSAGADQKLLLTHARGTLQPEDRGRGASHKEPVTAMMHVPGERFVTASRDQTAKTWALVGATRPATFDDAVPTVVDGTLIEIHDRPHMVLAGDDNSIRLYLIDTAGRFGAGTHRFRDAYERARSQLKSGSVARRGEAIHDLSAYDDSRSLELLAGHLHDEGDAKLRFKGTQLLANAKHPRVANLLEPLLKHDDEHVRMAAFEGLRAIAGKSDLEPLELALSACQANIGLAAVEALGPLAKKDDQARQMLIGALNQDPDEVRRGAIMSLEAVFAKTSAEASLIAAQSKRADVRRLALVRFYQRKLLGNSRVQGTVRRLGEDADADVRRMAFLVSLLSNQKLASAVRQRDKNLHRSLHELETFKLEIVEAKKKKKSAKDAAGSDAKSDDGKVADSEVAAPKKTKVRLEPSDFAPLLSAMSSRVTDTCLLGACSLARLEDARAFGTLLQLSRDPLAMVRVEVCRAFESLGDTRALQRLDTLINDAAESVRDAAYSGISSLRSDNPLAAADVGLRSSFVDVRSRGLQTLVQELRSRKKKATKSKSDDSRKVQALMMRALNDADQKVRGEAFKAALNLEIAGKGLDTLNFVLGSAQASVRREVLTESMAAGKKQWAVDLLYALLNDPSEEIRDDAFDHLNGLSKGKDIEPMKAALASKYVDMRLMGTKKLIARWLKAAQEALVVAIADEDKEVRLTALEALVDADAVDVLHQAMESQHVDVRLAAATARAKYRDAKSAAPLMKVALEKRPEAKEAQDRWLEHALLGLKGLALLQSSDCVASLLPLCDASEKPIRRDASRAIALSMTADERELVLPLLRNDDASVKHHAALGLALCGDEAALPIVFSEPAAKTLEPAEILMAACAFGEASESQLAEQLDSSVEWIARAAMIVLLSRDLCKHDGTPRRILLALGCRMPRLRLWAARALEAFGDRKAFAKRIVEFINDRGDELSWKLKAKVTGPLIASLAFGDPRFVQFIKPIEESKQRYFEFEWKVNDEVWQTEIEAAEKARTAAEKELPDAQADPSELGQLAFGTYVGLVREQGKYYENQQRATFGETVIPIRQAAMRRLIELAGEDASTHAATVPVIVQALGDPLVEIRTLAFEKLADLEFDNSARAEAALQCGKNDLALAGLKLLAGEKGKANTKILEDVIAVRSDAFAMEVAALLDEMVGTVAASVSVLESPYLSARRWIVNRLAVCWEKDPAAGDVLLQAAQSSRFDDVRLNAACMLAARKHEAAFDCLVSLLGELDHQGQQNRIVRSMVDIGDPRTSDVLIDAIESDTKKRIDRSAMLMGVRDLRDASAVSRVMALMDEKRRNRPEIEALVHISGYDQPIEDPLDDRPDRTWMDRQHPRHDNVLAALMQQLTEFGTAENHPELINAARWSLTNDADSVLARLASHPDDDFRHLVVESIGWRLKKRGGPRESLHTLLEHRDAGTKFRAAEGLAHAGDGAGLTILMSAVELMDDLRLRSRAVRALGQLSDGRAWDLLLRLASDDVHALQQAAAEAIGHLGTTDRREEIFELLKRIVNLKGSSAHGAVVGLRWLNVPEGWALIRDCVENYYSSHITYLAVKQLAFNDTPETREILLRQIHEGDYFEEAFDAARRLFGKDSLEPDYRALKGYYDVSYAEDRLHCLQRISENGASDRIIELLPDCEHAVRDVLASILINRDPLPVAAAAKGIASDDMGTVEVLARVLGQGGSSVADSNSHGKQIAKAIEIWTHKWQDKFDSINSGGRSRWYEDVDGETQTLSRLCWAAGRTGSAKKELLALIDRNVDLSDYRPVREAAVQALLTFKLTKTDLDKIAPLVKDRNSNVRSAVAQLLARADAGRAKTVAESVLADSQLFAKISQIEGAQITDTLTSNVGNVHYQAVVLPHVISGGHVDSLAETARSTEHVESIRFSAIEGLAKMGSQEAEEHLIAVGTDESSSEEIRKAAWRGLRRSKRVRTQ